MDITDIVNDKYWLGYAKKNIDNADANLKEAAGTLNKLIATFWGIYTAAFTAGSISGKVKIDNNLELILLILPMPVLLAGYVVTTFAQLPNLSTEKIDPRIPEDIMFFYNENIKEKKQWLWISFTVIIVSALSLITALSLMNYTNNKPKDSPASVPLTTHGQVPKK